MKTRTLIRKFPFINYVILAAFLAACAIRMPESTSMAASRRPNYVFILADDLDLMVTWSEQLRSVMPYTMSLRDRSIQSTNYFTAVICCEARAAIGTGVLAHNNGVYSNDGDRGGYRAFRHPLDPHGNPMEDELGRPVDNEERTFAKLLNDSGYRTTLIGKYMNGFRVGDDGKLPTPPLGWDEGHAAVDNNFYSGYNYRLMNWAKGQTPTSTQYGANETDYSTDVVSALAVQFINKVSAEGAGAPFLMHLTPTAPHLPLSAAPRHASRLKSLPLMPTNRPDYFADGDSVQDKPWILPTLSKRDTTIARLWTQKDWKNRLGSLMALDELIQKTVGALERTGLLENTIIVFTSDNGYNNGSHFLVNKMAPYDPSIRVPFFLFAGKNLPFGSPRKIDDMIMHVDIAPTFLDLAGVAVPKHVDGRSIAPLLRGEKPVWRRDHLEEYLGGYAGEGLSSELPPEIVPFITLYAMPGLFLDVPTHRMVRSSLTVTDNGVKKKRDYAYITWPGTTVVNELYDLERDPYELDNLVVYSPVGCRSVISTMAARLKTLSACSGDSCFTPPTYGSPEAPLEVSGCQRNRTGK